MASLQEMLALSAVAGWTGTAGLRKLLGDVAQLCSCSSGWPAPYKLRAPRLLTSTESGYRRLTGQRLSCEWRGTGQTMGDQTDQTDPTEQYDQPEHTDEQQPHPGLTQTMQDRPDHGEGSYRGSSRLTGKRAVITGADSGIGRAVALAFAREGADVVLSYLEAEDADADETVGLVEAEGRKAIRCPGDIRSEETCQKIIDTAVEQLGGIDVLVNNAAYQMAQMGGIADITTEQFDQVMKTNLYAMFWLCKKAIPHMEAGATIINTSSVQAVNPSPELLDYATTKGRHPKLHQGPRAGAGGEGHPGERSRAGPDLDAVDPGHHADGEGAEPWREHTAGTCWATGGGRAGLRLLRLPRVQLHHRRDARRHRRPAGHLSRAPAPGYRRPSDSRTMTGSPTAIRWRDAENRCDGEPSLSWTHSDRSRDLGIRTLGFQSLRVCQRLR